LHQDPRPAQANLPGIQKRGAHHCFGGGGERCGAIFARKFVGENYGCVFAPQLEGSLGKIGNKETKKKKFKKSKVWHKKKLRILSIWYRRKAKWYRRKAC